MKTQRSKQHLYCIPSYYFVRKMKLIIETSHPRLRMWEKAVHKVLLSKYRKMRKDHEEFLRKVRK